MSTRIVTTQAELDQALKDRVDIIDIKSPRGVWIGISAYGSASVRAYGSASVSASGSASVRAYDSASVRAYDSASVSAYGSASVRAYDSASVRAYGSASVSAYDSASVSAYGSASVSAYDSASVTASPHVAVHLHSVRCKIKGGVLIDITALDLNDPKTWLDHGGVTPARGKAILYKAVDDELLSGYGMAYPIGEKVTAPDWSDDNNCGGGLHLCPSPAQALAYHETATRFLACQVNVKDLRPIPSGGTAKCKVPSLKVLHEVDVHGRQLAVEA